MHKYRMLIGVAKGLDLTKASSAGARQQIKSLIIGSEKPIFYRRSQEYHTTTHTMTANTALCTNQNNKNKNSVRSTLQKGSWSTSLAPSSLGYPHRHDDRFIVSPPHLLKVVEFYSTQQEIASKDLRSTTGAATGIIPVDDCPISPRTHSQTHVRGMSIQSKSTFPKWPFAVMESRGNYKDDAEILEPVIGGPLYSAQSSLPRLPVPDLQETVSTFLPTALPLAETEQEARDLMNKCRVFPQQASKLQEKLIHRKEHDMKDTSWLQLWWNTAGYLQVRDPVTVNVSYYFNFKDDPTILDDDDTTNCKNIPHLGVKRGAALLYASAEFRKMICSGEFPHERIGRKEPKTPLCSVAFKYMFHCCRIPRREMDTYKMYDPSLHTHCIVARKGRFFSVDFVDDCGNPLGISVLEERLHRCIEMADANDEANEGLENNVISMLGWLTSSDRDSWADARQELLRIGGKPMEEALEKLESGALLLCLDNEQPVSKKECGDLFWTGSVSSGSNRWFDKSIQLFVTENGKAGLQGEHSMVSSIYTFIVSCVIWSSCCW